MAWSAQFDAYCERLGVGFWAEPLNAASNLAFVIAGLAAFALARGRARADPPVVWLSLLMVAIGVGSFLFHTFATAWAAMLDVAPIAAFVLAYFAVAMNRFIGFRWPRAILATGAFLAAGFIGGRLLRPLIAPVIGSSTGYLPALVGLVAVGAWLALGRDPRRRGAGGGLLAAATLFAVSLAFRVLDQPLCPVWPWGTHFVWHLLNAAVLFTVVLTLIHHGRKPAGEVAPRSATRYLERDRHSRERL